MHLESPLTPPLGSRGSNYNFSKSKYFANKCSQVCFRGDKNAFGVTPDPLGSWGHSGWPLGSNCNFSKSKYFANKSCQVCFRGDKNAFGVTPDPLGSRGHLGFAPGGQIETATNQKISLTKVVRYASGVTKWHLGSPLTHWGPGGTLGGPRGSN